MIMAKVKIEPRGPSLFLKPDELGSLLDYWEEGGDPFIVTFVEMSEEQVSALGDFEGF